MNLYDYQTNALTFVTFSKDKSKYYLANGVCGESGEVCDKIKKVIRDCELQNKKHLEMLDEDKRDTFTPMEDENPDTWFEDVKHGFILELGDVLWYLAVITKYNGYSFARAKCKPITKYIKNGFDVPIFYLTSELSHICSRISRCHIDERSASIKVPIDFAISIIGEISIRLGTIINEVALFNYDKLKSRKERNVINGSGDYR